MAQRRDEYIELDNDADLQWQASAACRGENGSLFYPPPRFERKDHRVSREKRAKSICSGCEVQESCLDYALRTAEPHGIWGGLNERERRDIAHYES